MSIIYQNKIKVNSIFIKSSSSPKTSPKHAIIPEQIRERDKNKRDRIERKLMKEKLDIFLVLSLDISHNKELIEQ